MIGVFTIIIVLHFYMYMNTINKMIYIIVVLFKSIVGMLTDIESMYLAFMSLLET